MFNLVTGPVGTVLYLGSQFRKKGKQAGAELGQAQLKLGLNFNLIFCRFGFTGYSLVESVWWTLFCRFY